MPVSGGIICTLVAVLDIPSRPSHQRMLLSRYSSTPTSFDHVLYKLSKKFNYLARGNLHHFPLAYAYSFGRRPSRFSSPTKQLSAASQDATSLTIIIIVPSTKIHPLSLDCSQRTLLKSLLQSHFDAARATRQFSCNMNAIQNTSQSAAKNDLLLLSHFLHGHYSYNIILILLNISLSKYITFFTALLF